MQYNIISTILNPVNNNTLEYIAAHDWCIRTDGQMTPTWGQISPNGHMQATTIIATQEQMAR